MHSNGRPRVAKVEENTVEERPPVLLRLAFSFGLYG